MKKGDAELVGFLLADGCLTIIRQKLARRYKEKTYHSVSYIPKVNVTQRVDGQNILFRFQKRFGGYISKNSSITKRGSRPTKYWVASSHRACREIASLVKRSSIPSPKIEAARILYKFCSWRFPKKSAKLGDIGRRQAQNFWEDIRRANAFHGVTN